MIGTRNFICWAEEGWDRLPEGWEFGDVAPVGTTR